MWDCVGSGIELVFWRFIDNVIARQKLANRSIHIYESCLWVNFFSPITLGAIKKLSKSRATAAEDQEEDSTVKIVPRAGNSIRNAVKKAAAASAAVVEEEEEVKPVKKSVVKKGELMYALQCQWLCFCGIGGICGTRVVIC